MTAVVKPIVVRKPAEISFDKFTDGGQPKSIGGVTPSFRRLPSEGPGLENLRSGVWETTTGTWRREDPKPEFCHVLFGEGTFTSDDGTIQEFGAGDTLFFPAHTKGVWNITQPLRKVFIVF